MGNPIPTSQSIGESSPLDGLLSAVASALDKRAGKDIFAIGGSVGDDGDTSYIAGNSITIRWDNKDQGHSRTLKLPLAVDPVARDAFNALLADCQPATFGIGSQEVLNEEYRKAGKMNTEDFCTNFNPYEHGIVDTINQVLAQASVTDARGLGVKAELYKLNVYSGPSGKFKPHVDTPRSDRQMGSLVVSLPVEHKGGQLAVRHGGSEIIFDWSPKSAEAIQWAAFFSDCEHEVLQVTEGHRVTLTYNLFWTNYGPASMSDNLRALDQESLHFFNALEKLLENKHLMKEGLVGFSCTHAYPHTSKLSTSNLHHMLKGIDMVVYQALKRILGTAEVAALVDDEEYRHDEQESITERIEWKKENWLKYQPDQPEPQITEAEQDILDNKLAIGRPLRPAVYFWHDYDNRLDPAEVNAQYGPDWQTDRRSFYSREDVTWLNGPPGKEASKELAVAFITYGNEPGIDAYYTSAVIVAKVDGTSKSDAGTQSGSVSDAED
ncbi:hypothetical protein FVEG_03561 [Fusarium verticillioides 7600]|uniref:Fe2OG dioxygenase domain-containing protein n=2 Tax=Gibberella moniliformis (strain M3125 / FGSC 7600) TaxID=334819 RepID=W7M1S8_GIBM7|nr:hypothetical protein FVEG_03561 [Fusarium verticillioides 7600]EWG41439.1 hypothetical protein FVEG_03561 [Fusarium verticillioides 7600]